MEAALLHRRGDTHRPARTYRRRRGRTEGVARGKLQAGAQQRVRRIDWAAKRDLGGGRHLRLVNIWAFELREACTVGVVALVLRYIAVWSGFARYRAVAYIRQSTN